MLENNGRFIELFEHKLSEFTGAPHVAVVDSGTNAIFLALKCLGIEGQYIEIPARTYMSVPMAIIHSGNSPVFVDYEWEGAYRLGDTPIIDACCRYHPNMFNFPPSTIHSDGTQDMIIMSFQRRKTLGIGKGGAILTNSKKNAETIRRMSFDGRNYMLGANDDNDIILGYHMNMPPEDAADGIMKMNLITESQYGDIGGSHTYRDLRNMEVFKQYE